MASLNNKVHWQIRWRRYGLMAACTVLLAACGGDKSDLELYMKQVKSRPPEAIDPIPPVKSADSFTYEAHGLRDPFRFEEAQVEDIEEGPSDGGPRPDLNRRKEYLEGFPLDTLKMVGTLSQGEVDWALIQDLDGLVHRVTEGNYMGQSHGRVVRVAADRVELSELVPDGNGGWLQRDAAISVTES